jgi:hypothetical protein
MIRKRILLPLSSGQQLPSNFQSHIYLCSVVVGCVSISVATQFNICYKLVRKFARVRRKHIGIGIGMAMQSSYVAVGRSENAVGSLDSVSLELTFVIIQLEP